MVDTDIDPNMFLNMLYRVIPYGFLEIRLIKSDRNSGHYPKIYWLELPATFNDKQLEYLYQQNEYGYNVYYGVTARSGKTVRGGGHASDALFTRVLWTDTDTKENAALERLRDAKPSFIVDSGGGYHGYWLLKKMLVLGGAKVPTHDYAEFESADDELLKRTLKGMAVHLQSDTKVADLARILRLPGFKNTKPERNGAICEVVESTLNTYEFMDLALQYAPLVAPPPRIDRTLPKVSDDKIPAYAAWYLRTPLGEGSRNGCLFVATRNYNDAGLSISQAMNELGAKARSDGLSESEIETTIGQGYKYAPSPILTTGSRRVASRDKKSNGRSG